MNGEQNFLLLKTPEVMLSVMRKLPHDRISNGFQFFGFLEQNIIDKWKEQLAYPDGFSDLGFGNWIYQRDNVYKTQICTHRSFKDFTVLEMKGLFDAITDSEVLGATSDILANKNHAETCTYPSEVCSNNEQASGQICDKNTCRLSDCLYQINEYHLQSLPRIWTPHLENITTCIFMYVCKNESTSCFLIPDELEIRLAYVKVIYDYIFIHLAKYVYHQAVILSNEDIITTKPQHDLAVGYYLNSTQDDTENQKYFIPGILEHAESTAEDEWSANRKRIVLYNCYDTIEAKTNFMWKSKLTQ